MRTSRLAITLWRDYAAGVRGTRHNPHWADIDFQIEADLPGLITPDCASSADIARVRADYELRDGFYGGLFVAAMTPRRSSNRTCERSSIRSHADSLLQRLCAHHPRRHSLARRNRTTGGRRGRRSVGLAPSGRCSDKFPGFNIDASLNGRIAGSAGGDLAGRWRRHAAGRTRTVTFNAAGIAALGFSGIPAGFQEQFSNRQRTVCGVSTWNTLIPACEKLARQNVTRAGGWSK